MPARTNSSGPAGEGTRARLALPAALVLATLACYANALDGPFLFDDANLANPLVFRTRPVVGLSFALDRALGASGTWTYHAQNVLVHALAGLALFGFVRRALDLVRGAARAPSNRGVAWCVALLWLLHPLQTESVAYISQRAEALAGLFTLGLLYGFVRSATEGPALRWALFALASFALGMATKETVAVAPLLVLFFDRQFLARGLGAALRQRARFHAALWALWLVLFALFPGRQLLDAFGPVEADSYVGVGVTFTPLEYARTQPSVILHYLWLSIWPHPLVLDHGWPAAGSAAEFVPHALVLALLLAGTLVALWRFAWIGFAGAWFFVNLAPTSSLVPIEDACVEHRMYLALAALVFLVVLLLEHLWRRLAPGRSALGVAGVALLASAEAAATVRRNQDYRSALRMWSTVVAHAPHNPRGYSGLGWALADAGRPAEAAEQFARVIELRSSPTDHLNLGLAYLHSGQLERALASLRRVQGSFPPESKPGQSLARALGELETRYRAQLARAPAAALELQLGILLGLQGKLEDSLHAHERALRLAPDLAPAHTELGLVLFELGRREEARAHLARAVELEPGGAQGRLQLGRFFLATGQHDLAAAQFREAARLEPRLAQARQLLARTLLAKDGASADETSEALRSAEEAAALEPGSAEILETLGLAHAARGNAARAREAYERALASLPGWQSGPLRERLRARLEGLRD